MIKNSNQILSGIKKSMEKSAFKLTNLKELKFENSYIKNLSINEVINPRKPQDTRGCNYTKVSPTSLKCAKLISLSKQCCEFLNLDYNSIKNAPDTAEYLSGNTLINNSEPVAQCYVGHQFGIFAGQLGDGRAITLGDLVLDENENEYTQLWELQLKGSGLTPYSRFADGRAVLRSSIREYICSEHLWNLGIPTTRALSIVGSDDTVLRDPLYTGKSIYEQCAVVCRVAPSFFRFGSFEIFKKSDSLSGKAGPSVGMEKEMLPKMLQYIGKFHYPNLYQDFFLDESPINFYKKLFELICIRTAVLSAYWQSYGFCHGVLNTDNMSILGLTIDYGPFGFLEFYDKNFICNHSDKHGRYAYSQQPKICKWNLNKLGEALESCLPLKDSQKILNDVYDKTYSSLFYLINAKKLGFFLGNDNVDSEDITLIDELYKLLDDFGFDLNLFFRFLSDINICDVDNSDIEIYANKMQNYSLNYDLKLQKIEPSINENVLNQLEVMKNINPGILYNYGVDPEFVENEKSKFCQLNYFKEKFPNSEKFNSDRNLFLSEWLNSYKLRLIKEFDKISSLNDACNLQTNNLEYIENLSKYALSENVFKNIVKSQCQNVILNYEKIKSFNMEDFNNFKKEFMNKLNPRFILRNHIVQRAIEQAEKGNYTELEKIMKIMTSPFDDHSDVNFTNEFDTSILLAYDICVSCSS